MVVIVAVVVVVSRAFVVTLLLLLETRFLLRRRCGALHDQVGKEKVGSTGDDPPDRLARLGVLRESVSLDRLPDLVALHRLSLGGQRLVNVGGHGSDGVKRAIRRTGSGRYLRDARQGLQVSRREHYPIA